MISTQLQQARDYEARRAPLIPEEERPAFHVTGGTGWINDPNGFSLYKGEYHLFFQYHPYSTQWGPMHWGHVKTGDLIRWERLPAALAPDTEADREGCFSGGAVELPDGRQLLMYTGVRHIRLEDGAVQERQAQCVAIGDGVDYEKHPGNPVLDGRDLPRGSSLQDFRDPKVWRERDGALRAAIGSRSEDGSGQILLYESRDGLHWDFLCILDRSRNEYGRMWECPDFFPLDGWQVLLTSPQEMTAQGLELHPGYGAICLLGSWDEGARSFTRERVQSIDYGLDFYAPQTLETPDGRRVMIAWMQNWTTSTLQPPQAGFWGEMTLPRELSVQEGRLIQRPVRELDRYHGRRTAFREVRISGETALPGIGGRILDMSLSVRPGGEEGYRWFQLDVARDERHATTIRYEPGSDTIRIDRTRCGFPHDIVHIREFPVRPHGGRLDLRIVMDRHSLELFVNGGEQAATCLLYTPQCAGGIRFQAEGSVLLDVEKYDLDL